MKFADYLRKAFSMAIIGGVVYGTGSYFYGKSDEEGARQTLDDIGIKVIDYKGHPAFNIQNGIYSDKFEIEAKGGKHEEVIVSRGVMGPSTISVAR